MEVWFWLSIFGVFYAYLGYPLVLYFGSMFFGQKEVKSKWSHWAWPKVSLLISAYNEEDIIENKILNSLALDYPRDRLEIVVISDGSDDRTPDIAGHYGDEGVRLRHYEGRIGKTACLNKAVPLAEGDIVLFSDANSIWDKHAVSNLVGHFVDTQIGFVTGHTRYLRQKNGDVVAPISTYGKLETFTKKYESKVGSCVGADGAIFAIRKELYRPLNSHDINDFVIPMNVIRHGYRGIFTEKAVCYEKTAPTWQGEFRRQVRITARTLRAIFEYRKLLNPIKYPFFSFALISHKLLKFIVPYLLVFIVIANLLLVIGGGGLCYKALLMGQIACYCGAWLDSGKVKLGGLSRITSNLKMFVVVNLAVLVGWLGFIQGKRYMTWQSSR